MVATASTSPPKPVRSDDDLASLIAPAYHRAVLGDGDPALEAEVRAALADDGCAVIRDFLAPEGLARAEQECAAVKGEAYFSREKTNPYNTADDESLPEGHPRRIFLERTQGFVARDFIPREAVIARLYESPAFQRTVAAWLGKPRVYEYADPFASLVVNVLEPGATHPWHYDTNEFIVSMMVRQPEGGGLFEYCPQIRSPGDERYDAVRGVITGTDRAPVRTLKLRPGDLQLFFGRFSLHRVTPVEGDACRLTAIFAYCEQPGVVGRPKRTKQLFGRLAPVHEAQAQQARDDGLVD